MKKIKIIIFLYSLGGGGVQRFVMNLISNLNKNKYEICIALVSRKGIYLNELPKEIKIIDLKAKRVHFSLFPLIKVLNTEKPDILFSIDTNINIIAIIAKLLSRSNPRMIIRQAVEPSKLSTSKISMVLTKFLYPKVDKCVVLTNSMKESILNITKIPCEKIEVIYNSIDINSIVFKREEEINEYFKTIKEPKIVTVGRLTKQKNQLMLIEAFSLVLQKYRAKLIIIGEGDDRIKIEEKIKEKNIENDVILLGYKQNPYKYIYNSDIFVLTSLYEGLSNALLEAIACDVPIVTTDNPDDIIKNQINGFQAEINKNDIAEKIIQLITNKELSNLIKKNNHEYMNNFDITRMINKYDKLFDKNS